ncbi:MAG: hypothetical protein EOM55_03635 [Clostridia bacterium]|nr:hypothetical protein [Clostridia bacterium]
MPKSHKEINALLLGEIYHDLQTGKQNINNVIDKVKDCKLKRELKKQFKEYDNYSETCEDLAKDLDIVLKDNNFFVKMRMWLSVNLATMLDKSNRKIATMSILGSTMGVISLMSALSDCKKCKNELLNFCRTVIETEENNIVKLKPYILVENNINSPEVATKAKKTGALKSD